MRRCKKERKSSRGWVVFVLQMGIGSFKMSECLGIHKRKRKGEIYTPDQRNSHEQAPYSSHPKCYNACQK
jgi:hypothetical protein